MRQLQLVRPSDRQGNRHGKPWQFRAPKPPAPLAVAVAPRAGSRRAALWIIAALTLAVVIAASRITPL